MYGATTEAPPAQIRLVSRAHYISINRLSDSPHTARKKGKCYE